MCFLCYVWPYLFFFDSIDANAGLMTHFEVLQLLKQSKSEQNNHSSPSSISFHHRSALQSPLETDIVVIYHGIGLCYVLCVCWYQISILASLSTAA